MLSACVQSVNSLRKANGMNCVRRSTPHQPRPIIRPVQWVQVVFTPLFSRTLSSLFSTAKVAFSPPLHDTFYPVSTQPTNSSSIIKRRKGL